MTTILIVEDDATTRQLIRASLDHNEGWTILEAADGHQALEIGEEEPIDLVLLDYDLPDTDGLHLLDEFRSWEGAPAVVLLTGQGDEKVAMQALSRGAVDYLVKSDQTYEHLANFIEDAEGRWRRLEGPLRELRRQEDLSDDLEGWLEGSGLQAAIAFQRSGDLEGAWFDDEIATDLLVVRAANLLHMGTRVAEGLDGTPLGQTTVIETEDHVVLVGRLPGDAGFLAILPSGTPRSRALSLADQLAARMDEELSGGTP